MDKLVEALQIFLKYKNLTCPISCEHDILYIVGIEPGDVSVEDMERLDELGFYPNDTGEVFISYTC